MEPLFLTVDEVLEIHTEQIERYGGSSGLRDAAALQSAVTTPQATFDGEFLHKSIPAMAAAYNLSSLPKPSVHRRQQESRRKLGHHVSADQ